MTNERLVYYFSSTRCDGSAQMGSVLGGKGANLAEMCKIGVPVPPGFTISTDVCALYSPYKKLPPNVLEMISQILAVLENEMGCKFGDHDNPLLLSVRSGSVTSMPGMLDTVLNVGLNDQTVEGLSTMFGKRFAYDSYRRFIQMYASVVLQIDLSLFEEAMEQKKQECGITRDSSLTADDLAALVTEFKAIVLQESAQQFTQNVVEQLYTTISAVFASWMNARAISYRQIHGISEALGTAVNVQAMVFGNLNDNSATGVCFTRNPSTGEKKFFGEFLVNAQGEDVVAGIRTPLPINSDSGDHDQSMSKIMPDIYVQLVEIYQKLERHYRDMQDIEFTVQDRKLWILQTRCGKRTVQSAIRIAVDMVEEGLITKEEAIQRIDPGSLSKLLHPILDSSAEQKVIGKGLPASPGASSGRVVFTSAEAELLAKAGKKVILVRTETNPEDIQGMSASVGVVTARGGMTSHAAVVARGMGKPCICSVTGLYVDKTGRFFVTGSGLKVSHGDYITINGTTGEVILGMVHTIPPQLSEYFYTIMRWSEELAVLGVRANADTPEDAELAMKFNADGIGLCRTEHMFFCKDRITIVQEMITAENVKDRQSALDKLQTIQTEDFNKIFAVINTKPVTVRLLDPPLHEFLPNNEESIAMIASNTGRSVESIKARILALSEKNPMLGHRGCRLAISYPEIYEMQMKAILSAASYLKSSRGLDVIPEIMVPLVMDKKEVLIIAAMLKKIAADFPGVKYLFGTMIELPRAALMADDIALFADFFSFGTNDLTQTAMGISRDDSSSFISVYKEQGIFQKDPFEVLDQEGVGKLIKIAVELGRKSSPNIKMSLCGEHGGDPESIRFCSDLGLNYVSCSPYRIPVAKLVAAQCAVEERLKVAFNEDVCM